VLSGVATQAIALSLQLTTSHDTEDGAHATGGPARHPVPGESEAPSQISAPLQ
jgi:hypothetical protein